MTDRQQQLLAMTRFLIYSMFVTDVCLERHEMNLSASRHCDFLRPLDNMLIK